MLSTNEHIYVEFHDKAKEVLFSALRSFESSVKKLNRKTEEYHFQELKNKYVHVLKLELETCANDLIQKHHLGKQPVSLNQNLQHFINEYLHLFLQKIRSI